MEARGTLSDILVYNNVVLYRTARISGYGYHTRNEVSVVPVRYYYQYHGPSIYGSTTSQVSTHSSEYYKTGRLDAYIFA